MLERVAVRTKNKQFPKYIRKVIEYFFCMLKNENIKQIQRADKKSMFINFVEIK